jgi:hypothetical protein
MTVRISAALLGAVALVWGPTAGAVDCANGKHIPANDPACSTSGGAPGDVNNLTVRKAGEKPIEYLKAPDAKSGTGGSGPASTGTITNNGGTINDKR